MTRVAVASRSFSGHPVLRAELLARYPQAAFNDSDRPLAGEALRRFLAGHERAIVGPEPVDEPLLAALPDLAVISKFGSGVDRLDLPALTRRGIRLGWTGGINRRSTAELVVAFALVMLRRLSEAYIDLRAGGWRPYPGRQLSERTVGILGCGHVGKEAARLFAAFGCRLLVHDVRDFPNFYRRVGIEPVGLVELLRRSEVLSVHLPLDDSTRGLLDAERLALMPPDAVLINTARGGIVDEAALESMLYDGRLGGAAFDVFGHEPPGRNGLLRLPNFFATPHLGGNAEEAVLDMGRAAIRGLEENKVPEPGDEYWPDGRQG